MLTVVFWIQQTVGSITYVGIVLNTATVWLTNDDGAEVRGDDVRDHTQHNLFTGCRLAKQSNHPPQFLSVTL